MAKLTKAQREFFYEFARNDLGNSLFPILHAQGIELTPELANDLLDLVDLTKYTEIIGAEFLERVDFATLKRIDKIMKSEDFNKTVIASHDVAQAVHDERIRILSVLIPTEEEEG